MTELSSMRSTVVRALRALDAVPVENGGCSPGTPDVEYIGGWLELKWARCWPARGGPLRLRHFTTQQRLWMRRRSRRGGAIFLLLQVGQEWLLLPPVWAAERLGEADQEEIRGAALLRCPRGLAKGALLEWLRNARGTVNPSACQGPTG